MFDEAFVAFDVDGTLFDSVEMTVRAAADVLGEAGARADRAEIQRFIGKPIEAFNDWLASRVPERLADRAVKRFAVREYELMQEVAELYDGVPEMLDELAGTVAALGLYSNGRADYVNAVLDLTGLRGRFAVVRPRRSDEDGKHPVVADLVARLGLTRGVLVGDRDGDVQAGHAHGLQVIGATYGYGDEGELDEADALVASPAEVPEQVRRLLSG